MYPDCLRCDDNNGGVELRLKGYVTIEASYIFTIVTLIVLGLIRVTFYIHDGMLSDCCTILGGIRYYQAKEFYYTGESIREKEIANAPIIGDSYEFIADVESKIVKNMESYYDEKKLSSEGALSTTDFKDVITVKGNADLVQAGGEAVKLIGGVMNGN